MRQPANPEVEGLAGSLLETVGISLAIVVSLLTIAFGVYLATTGAYPRSDLAQEALSGKAVTRGSSLTTCRQTASRDVFSNPQHLPLLALGVAPDFSLPLASKTEKSW